MAFVMSQLRGMSVSAPRREVRPMSALAGAQARPAPRSWAVRSAAFPSATQQSGQKASRPSRGALQVVASAADTARDKADDAKDKAKSLELSIEQDSRADWANIAAVAGFAAYWYNKLTVDRMLLLKTLAVLQLFVSVTNLLSKAGTTDKITTIIGPAVLATFVLNIRVSFLDAAVALFGFYLSHEIEGPFYLWVATLAAALYYGYGTLWYTVAFSVVSLTKFLRAAKNEDRLPLLSIPAVLVGAWSVYTERHFVWTLLLFIAQAAFSGFTTVEKLSHKLD